MNVNSFLRCKTPNLWLEQAEANLSVLLTDHANCEKKAASTALNLITDMLIKPI
jgi:tRNA-(ms[2]io[6]A)-hydroxylase